MDRTPTKTPRCSEAIFEDAVVIDSIASPRRRIRKPPPVTPRRFNKFFTPRTRSTKDTVRTSRKALRAISASALNSRQYPRIEELDENGHANEDVNPHKRRKLDSTPSTPKSAVSENFNFLPSSQEPPRSSPLKHDIESADQDNTSRIDNEEDDDDASTVDLNQPRIKQFPRTSLARSLLRTRLTGKHSIRAVPTTLYQSETAGFYSSDKDLNGDFTSGAVPCLPFSIAACHTNPIVATGDEEGWIRLIDTSNTSTESSNQQKTLLRMRPHDNALMDLDFSSDDSLLATASGDQTCQILDVQQQVSLYSLRSHTSSVKRIQFQPGSGDKVLASCGRDGRINFWDLRVRGSSTHADARLGRDLMPFSQTAQVLTPVNTIADAHTAGSKYSSTTSKAKPNNVPGRNDFSITSLTFLGQARSHLLATASEVDTVVKIWDMRVSHAYSARSRNRLPTPITSTQEPEHHAVHRRFGINSLVLGTDCSRLYALSRDHTVYAYSTSHLIMGSTPKLSSTSSVALRSSESGTGLGPLYGFQHPYLRVSTFWPRLSIRKSTHSQTELLAVGSTDDCAVLFPTSERYLSKFTQSTPTMHNSSQASISGSRPQLFRSLSSSFNMLTVDRDDNFPIYRHGTPLVKAHTKEVTSLTWTSEGNLCTNSDDYTMRCWRENPKMARQMRIDQVKDQVNTWRKGWASVGIESFDDTD